MDSAKAKELENIADALLLTIRDVFRRYDLHILEAVTLMAIVVAKVLKGLNNQIPRDEGPTDGQRLSAFYSMVTEIYTNSED